MKQKLLSIRITLAVLLGMIMLGTLAWSAPQTPLLAGNAVVEEGSRTQAALAASILLTKTVGANAAACAASQAITVPPNTPVTYCYQATNTGDVTFTLHTLNDTHLGWLLFNFPYTLTPGASIFVTHTIAITQTTLNTASWLASDGSTPASDSDSANVTVAPPSIAFTKTVGVEPAACASTQFIAVPLGSDVTYCYTVKNTGLLPLTTHSLVDDQIGVLLNNQAYSLAPGASFFVTRTVTLSQSVVNSATWTAADSLDNTAFASDSASVNAYTTPPTAQTFAPFPGQLITQKGSLPVSGKAWTGDALPPFPAAPTLGLTRLDSRQYYITWTPSPSATDYILYEDTVPSFNSPTLHLLTPPATQKLFVKLPAEDGVYYYHLKTTNASGSSRFSNLVSVTVPIPTLAYRAPLAATSNITVQIRFNPAGSTANPWHSATTTPNAWGGWDWNYAWALPEVINAPYTIQTRAVDSLGNTGPIDTITVTLDNKIYLVYFPLIYRRWPPVPYAPTLALSTPDASRNFVASWTYSGATPVSTYTLQEASNDAFSADIVNYYPGTATSQSITGKGPGLYYYHVRGNNSYGPGDWSTPKFVILPPTLNAISNPSQSPSFVVSWSTSRNSPSYILEEATTINFTNSITYTSPVISYTVTGKTGGVYYYRVRSVYGALTSPNSNIVSTTVTSGYYDDFDNPNTGWEVRRYDDDSYDVQYLNGSLCTLEFGSRDFLVASPMVAAPALPYTITAKVMIIDEEVDGRVYEPTISSFGLIFGGNGGTPCPADRYTPMYQGCLSHYYRLMMIWGTVAPNSFDWGLKRIDYHEPDDGQGGGGGGAGRGVDLDTGVASGMNINGWNVWRIRVTATGIKVYVKMGDTFTLLGESNDATYVNDPYFGVFMSSKEGRVGYKWDWYIVQP